MNQPIDFVVQDASTGSANNLFAIDLHALATPISGGTSVLFPGAFIKGFTPSTIFTLTLAT